MPIESSSLTLDLAELSARLLEELGILGELLEDALSRGDVAAARKHARSIRDSAHA